MIYVNETPLVWRSELDYLLALVSYFGLILRKRDLDSISRFSQGAESWFEDLT